MISELQRKHNVLGLLHDVGGNVQDRYANATEAVQHTFGAKSLFFRACNLQSSLGTVDSIVAISASTPLHEGELGFYVTQTKSIFGPF